MKLSQDSEISWSYYVADENKTGSADAIISYEWSRDSRTPCLVTCGSGFKISETLCFENTVRPLGASVREVDRALCNGDNEPTIFEETCFERSCPPEWWVGPWQQCVALDIKVSHIVTVTLNRR